MAEDGTFDVSPKKRSYNSIKKGNGKTRKKSWWY